MPRLLEQLVHLVAVVAHRLPRELDVRLDARLLRRHLLERLLEDLGQLGDGLRERVEPRLQVRDLVLLLGLEGREKPALVLYGVEPLLECAERDAEVEAHPRRGGATIELVGGGA